MSRKKVKKILLIVSVVIFISSLAFFFSVKVLRFKTAQADIKTMPEATVFIDGKEKGTTPYKEVRLAPGEKVIRLVPKDSSLPVWERSVTLSPNTHLFIQWEFASNPDEEQGDIIYLEKIASDEETGLILTSTPNNAAVSIDGQINEFSPVNLSNLPAGNHKVSVSYPGYKTREFLVEVVPGYRLVIETKLASKPVEETAAEETPEEETGAEAEISLPQVEIKETPTGWLRVREGPSLTATEAAKVKPGEKYTLLDEKSGWYKISYEEGKEGWISSRYAKKLE